MPTAIPSASSILPTTSTNDAVSRVMKGSLEQADFLKMLTLQLQNQDPLNPQTNTDFAAQMAQFTALEQSREMSGNMTLMLQQQEVQNATLMLGTQVLLDDGRTGVVDRVSINKDGSPRLLVGGKEYALAQVMNYQIPAPVEPKGPTPGGP
ncbi:MAG: flagellar hook assembly protein FlgD [Verrucomicrobiota bacterium]